MSRTHRLPTFLFTLCLFAASAPAARAEVIDLQGWGPFALRPGDILHADFDVRAIQAYTSIENNDYLLFTPGVGTLEPIVSYTARLYDRGTLLGTVTTAPGSGAPTFGSFFTAPGSLFTGPNSTIVDFTTLRNGTFDGAVEFEIGSGFANIYRASDELDFGQGMSGSGFSPRTFRLITPDAAPVPEPATLFLIGTGLAGLAASKRRRISH